MRKDYEERDLAFCLGLLCIYTFLLQMYHRVMPDIRKLPRLQLVAVVCYYGKHYSTFVFHSKLKTWIYFDDATVREVSVLSASVSVFHSVGVCLSAHLSAYLHALSSFLFLCLPGYLYVHPFIRWLVCVIFTSKTSGNLETCLEVTSVPFLPHPNGSA